MNLSENARAILIGILRGDKDGRLASFEFAEIKNSYPTFSKTELEQLLGELQYTGLIGNQPVIGANFGFVRPTLEAVANFALEATGFDVDADAVTIARLWLDDEAYQRTSALAEHLKWPYQRLNWALYLIRECADSTWFSREINPKYTFSQVVLNPSLKARLRDWVDRGTLYQ